MSEKYVLREAWSPEMTSQSFSVSCFWSRGFVPHWKWNLTLWYIKTRGRKITIAKFLLLYITVHWEDLIQQINKICHIHLKLSKHEIVWTQHTFLNRTGDDSKRCSDEKAFFAIKGRTDITWNITAIDPFHKWLPIINSLVII